VSKTHVYLNGWSIEREVAIREIRLTTSAGLLANHDVVFIIYDMDGFLGSSVM
jgi:hypothetical protein